MGNLASAIFVPYRAECGPAGSLFGVLATFVMEVLKAWPILRRPALALFELLGVMFILVLFGLVPWVDNYAHIVGFVTGLLLSYALLPNIQLELVPEKKSTQIMRVAAPIIFTLVIFLVLVTILYAFPLADCEVCKLLSCVPFVHDFCSEQNIDFETKFTKF